eukprot:GHVL01033636.1.p1 GENE.GHVL01033636.1~~GHVL01033636.1.p1  ORF type:complete len:436 (+),score=98.41 GHVL01033636.1:1672-2979(+)
MIQRTASSLSDRRLSSSNVNCQCTCGTAERLSQLKVQIETKKASAKQQLAQLAEDERQRKQVAKDSEIAAATLKERQNQLLVLREGAAQSKIEMECKVARVKSEQDAVQTYHQKIKEDEEMLIEEEKGIEMHFRQLGERERRCVNNMNEAESDLEKWNNILKEHEEEMRTTTAVLDMMQNENIDSIHRGLTEDLLFLKQFQNRLEPYEREIEKMDKDLIKQHNDLIQKKFDLDHHRSCVNSNQALVAETEAAVARLAVEVQAQYETLKDQDNDLLRRQQMVAKCEENYVSRSRSLEDKRRMAEELSCRMAQDILQQDNNDEEEMLRVADIAQAAAWESTQKVWKERLARLRHEVDVKDEELRSLQDKRDGSTCYPYRVQLQRSSSTPEGVRTPKGTTTPKVITTPNGNSNKRMLNLLSNSLSRNICSTLPRAADN